MNPEGTGTDDGTNGGGAGGGTSPTDDGTKGANTGEKRLLREKKELEEKYTTLTKALGGLTPEQVAAAVKAQEQAEEERQKKAGELDKIIEKRVREAVTPLQEQLARASSFEEKYHTERLEREIKDAAIAAGVDPSDLNDVVDITKNRRIKFNSEANKFVVLDKDGDETAQTVAQFFADTFKKEKPKFYMANVGRGGGSRETTSAVRGSGVVDRRDNAAFNANVDAIAAGKVKAV